MADAVNEISDNAEEEKVAEEVVKSIEKESPKKANKKTPKKPSKKKDIEEISEQIEGNMKDIEKMAEAESTDEERAKSLEEKKKALLEKARKLKEKVSVEPTTEELKEKVKIKKRTDMLIPLEEYVKAGIYLGTRVVTPNMRPFVYRRRADGLAIFNTDLIDEKLKEGIQYLSKFNPKDVIVVCKRQAGWKAVQMFSKLTGVRAFTKKYPAGILTNTTLPDFFENELTIITDQWVDKNALNDTLKVNKNVLMVCDTNNFSKGADQIIIGNNKSEKSIGVIFYLLTKGYLKAREHPTDNVPELDWWTGEKE